MKFCIRILLIFLLLAGALSGCADNASSPAPQEAVNTAVAETVVAQALAEATVNAAMLTAMPSTATALAAAGAPALTATLTVTLTAAPVFPSPTVAAIAPPVTPTPVSIPSVDYVALTEEELTQLIDAAVAQAVSATEATSQAVNTTTGGDAITAEDIYALYPYYDSAAAAIAEAEALLEVYYALYGELADEMIDEIQTLEDDLEALNESLLLISVALEDATALLAQGLALTEETIAQLEAAAQLAQAGAQALQMQQQDLLATLQTDQQHRLDQLSQLQPNAGVTSRIDALQSGFEYIDFAKDALADDTLTREEMLALGQLGVNAQAGFQQFAGVPTAGVVGGPDLGQVSGKFSEINTQIALGQMPQAEANLQSFEAGMGQRPNGLSDAGLPDSGVSPGRGDSSGGNLPGRRP